MRHHTLELFKRLGWLALMCAAFLTAVVVWFGRDAGSGSASGPFKPARRIADVGVLSEAIARFAGVGRTDTPLSAESAPDASATTPDDAPLALGCGLRQRSVLMIRMIKVLPISEAQARRIHDELAAMRPNDQGCDDWAANVQTALRLHSDRSGPAPVEGLPDVEASLTLQVSWTRKTPCVFHCAGPARRLLLGSALHCAPRDHAHVREPGCDARNYRSVAEIARKRLLASSPVQLEQLANGHRTLSLDAGMQSVLDGLVSCLRQPSTCVGFAPAGRVGHLSAVLLDVDTGGILAATCWSGPCDRAPYRELGPLAGLLVESPPASAVKLLHALAFAQARRVDPAMLALQIKTSGQLDASVTKRNEWWEKQAICDASPGKPCAHAMQLSVIARKAGWGVDCQSKGTACGRVGLVEGLDAGTLPGFVGKIRPSTAAGRAAVLLPWDEYDRIRRDGRTVDTRPGYFETALAVQSVIGAGDSRVSPLGLAHMAAQIRRAADGLPLRAPSLFLADDPSGLTGPEVRWPADPARTVLAGMRKVIEPVESGWRGAGTAAGAFERQFGRPCVGDCGLWGKTGTVSRQDPRFAGATVFAGLIDPDRLGRWRGGSADKVPGASRARRLALGVVVLPGHAAPPGHLASIIAIRLADDLSRPRSDR